VWPAWGKLIVWLAGQAPGHVQGDSPEFQGLFADLEERGRVHLAQRVVEERDQPSRDRCHGVGGY